MEEIKNIINIQKYLIAGFIQDGHIEEYEGILIPDMFGRFKKEFKFLQNNGNKITPDFAKNIGGEKLIEFNECYSSSFISDRNKYVKELYKFYVKDKILKEGIDTEYIKNIQNVYAKLDYIETSLDFSPISYEQALSQGYEELINTNKKNVMSWGWSDFDKKLGYLMGGQLILIGGTTGTGKSTFVNQICYNVAKQGFKVARFSLEDRLEEKRKEEIYYTIGRIRKKKGLKNYPWSEFEANLITGTEFNTEISDALEILTAQNKNIIDFNKKKQVKITDLEKMIENQVKNGCKLFVVDHLHYFDMGNDKDRHDLTIQSIMHKINELARVFNITIILLAHYKKLGRFKPTNEDFKDGNSISQVANKIIHIYRENFEELGFESETDFIISKNRSPTGCGTIKGKFNTGTYEYDFTKSSLQTEREYF